MSELERHTRSRGYQQAMLSRTELARSIGELRARLDTRTDHRPEFERGALVALDALVALWGLDPGQVAAGERQERARLRLRTAKRTEAGR